MSEAYRFWSRVDRSNPCACWVWPGAHNGRYGQITLRQTRVYAHRYAYECRYGKIPNGMVVMHRCDNTMCVNPEHLTIGTQADNLRDMAQKGRRVIPSRKTQCIHGHPYPENAIPGKRGTQACRECSNARRRKSDGRGPYKPRKIA